MSTDEISTELIGRGTNLLTRYPEASTVTLLHPSLEIPCVFHRHITEDAPVEDPHGPTRGPFRLSGNDTSRGTRRIGISLVDPPPARVEPEPYRSPEPRENSFDFNSDYGILQMPTSEHEYHHGDHMFRYPQTVEVKDDRKTSYGIGSMMRNTRTSEVPPTIQSVGSNHNLITRNLPVNTFNGIVDLIASRSGVNNGGDFLNRSLFEYTPPAYPLDVNIRSRLPETVVEEVSSEIKKCTICLSSYETGENRLFLPCFHSFHTECVDEWFKTSHSCPECRHDLHSIPSF